MARTWWRLFGCLLAVWAAWMLPPAVAIDARDSRDRGFDTEPRGSLVIIGGSERFDQKDLWQEIVNLAGGPGSRIAVIPVASADPIRKGNWVITALNRAGADAFLVPLGFKKFSQTPAEAAHDQDLCASIREATGVFMIGGEQERIVKSLYDANGDTTPMLDAIWDLYQQGGVIAGTSAGAAVMSREMYREADSVLETLISGVRMGKELDRGLGFLDGNWFVDQHCLVRGRFARTLVAMHDRGFKYGIGIDENSAVVVRGGRDCRVIGYKGALVMDLSRAEHDPELGKFNLSNVRLTYLDRGDAFDLKTLEVVPSVEKLEDEKLDPKSPDFRPAIKQTLFDNNILGNSTVVDLMSGLMRTVSDFAIGQAFDGQRAREEAVDGFEFRFTRDDESVAWYTEVFGGDDYTVVNIRLDIRPIRITGPIVDELK